MLVQIKVKPESEKFTHDQVGYEVPSTHPGQRCENCEHFIPETDKSPAGCEGVQRPIAEEAWCHRYERDNMKKHHKYTHTTIEHHDDGSHTITHHHEDGKSHVKYSRGHHDAMMDGIMDHTSAPNPGEAEAEAGPAQAAPAAGAAPMAAPAGA